MPTASPLLIIVTPLINPFYQTAADAIPRNKQTMIHDFCQIGPLTLNPNWSQAKRRGFNAGINSRESDCRWLPCQRGQMKLFVFYESLQMGTEVWAWLRLGTPWLLPNLEQRHTSRRNDWQRTWLVSCSRSLLTLRFFLFILVVGVQT